MSKATKDNSNEGFELYKKGYRLIEIARKLGVSDSTVRSWKRRQQWDKKLGRKKAKKKSNVASDVEGVARNTDLNDKQKLFCIYFIKYFNATKAYQKVYKCKYESAMVGGSNLLSNPKIAEEINRLKMNKLNQIYLKESDIFQKYLDIAYADMTDFVEFGTKEVEIVNDEGKKEKAKIAFTTIKNSDEVDGTLISEISNNAKGVKIKLQDRLKALDWLSKHMNMATEEQKAKVEKIKAEIELLKVRKEKAEEEEW